MTFFIDKPEMAFGKSRRLAEFTEDYVFFTPALLYLKARCDDRPLADFMNQCPDVKFMHHKFPSDVFAGLGADQDQSWNKVLWAVDKPFWPPFKAFLETLTLYDSSDGFVAAVRVQPLRIYDPLAGAPQTMEVWGAAVIAPPRVYRFSHQLQPRAQVSPVPMIGDNPFAALAAAADDADANGIAEANAGLVLEPVRLQIQPTTQLSPAKQAEIARLISEYKKEFLA